MRMPIVFRFCRLKMRKSVSGALGEGCVESSKMGAGAHNTIKLNIYNNKFQVAHTYDRAVAQLGKRGESMSLPISISISISCLLFSVVVVF